MDNQQLSINSEKGQRYQVGDIVGDLKILEKVPLKSTYIVECLLCGKVYETNSSNLSSRRVKETRGCKFCYQKQPLRWERYKYHPGDFIGDYELIECTGRQEGKWLARCTKCGQEQVIRICNAKKRISSGCSYCNSHTGQRMPQNTKNKYIKPVLYTLDERSYKNYKKKFENYNSRETRKYKEFNLSLEEWTQLIHGDCYYCGAPPTLDNFWNKIGNQRKTSPENFSMNGIDRIDSSKGYTFDNCVPCCKMCNTMKHDFNTDDWYRQMRKILNHVNKSSTTIESTEKSGSEQSTL